MRVRKWIRKQGMKECEIQLKLKNKMRNQKIKLLKTYRKLMYKIQKEIQIVEDKLSICQQVKKNQ